MIRAATAPAATAATIRRPRVRCYSRRVGRDIGIGDRGIRDTGVGDTAAGDRGARAHAGGQIAAVGRARVAVVAVRGRGTDDRPVLEQKLSTARNGTLCIDAVELLPPAVQRVLATRLALADRPRVVLVLAATPNQPCYERLQPALAAALGDPIRVPSLRERMVELPWLVADVLARSHPTLQTHVSLVEQALVRPWPGNIGELVLEIADAHARAAAAKSRDVRTRHLAERAGQFPITAIAAVADDAMDNLTRRERDVLAALVEGQSEKEIAAGLDLSGHTVHQHAKAVYRKLGVRSRGELLSRFVTR